MAATTLTGTTGNDVLNAPGSVSTLVQGLQGVDTITLTHANDEAQAGKGNDLVTLSATGTIAATVFGGSGNDTVNFNGATTYAGLTKLGRGSDSIAVNGIINGANIYGGADADTIRLQNTITNSTIGGGSGADILSFTGADIGGSRFASDKSFVDAH